MPETLFTLDTDNYHKCQHLFRGERNQEYYRGDYWVDDAQPVDVRAQRCVSGPYTIIKMSAATPQYFRRTRKHIREDATDLSVLWFVKSGTMSLSDHDGVKTAGPGAFMISRSMSPFFIELQPDRNGQHEVLHMTVPTHLLRMHLPQEIATSVMLDGSSELAIAKQILTTVFEEQHAISEQTCQLLVETALKTVGHALSACGQLTSSRQTIAERRLDEVLRYIQIHLSDPNLCTSMVSEGCGVSQRYLSLLLQSTGTTFSELVWTQRLEMARAWLERSDPRDIAISEIAYGVGFKSTAHFSRKFKRAFGQNPSELRMNVETLRDACLDSFSSENGARLRWADLN